MTSGLQGPGRGIFGFQERLTSFLRPDKIGESSGGPLNQPIFESPAEARENKDPNQLRSSENSNSPENDSNNLPQSTSSLGPITATLTQGGRSLDALTALQDAGPQGGTRASVSNGSLTLENTEGESLKVSSDKSLTFRRQENGSVKIFKGNSEQSLTVEADTSLSTSGEGQLNFFEDSNFVSLEGGESLRIDSNSRQTVAVKSIQADSIELAESGNTINVTSQRNDQTDSLTLLNGTGESIRLEQGESGSLQRNEDGSITLSQDDSDRSVTFETNDSVSVVGEASATVRSERTGGSMELTKGDNLSLAGGDENNFSIKKDPSQEKITINSADEQPDLKGPLQVRFFENPVNQAQQELNNSLLNSTNVDSQVSDENSQDNLGANQNQTDLLSSDQSSSRNSDILQNFDGISLLSSDKKDESTIDQVI